MAKVAVITGGASGMGLAVAKSLAGKAWKVVIADLNAEAGKNEAASISATYIQTDVKDQASLSNMFEQAYKEHGQINFVFANAGIGERHNFYGQISDSHMADPVPGLDMCIDINLKSVISTTYLAQHYFRKTRTTNKDATACLILNASIAGIWPVRFCPIYTAAKHGVVGFARAIERRFFETDGIRVNALCPGNVRTPFFTDLFTDWDIEWIETPQIVKIVELMLFDESMHGQIIEAAPREHFIIETPAYTNENCRKTLEDVNITHMGK